MVTSACLIVYVYKYIASLALPTWFDVRVHAWLQRVWYMKAEFWKKVMKFFNLHGFTVGLYPCQVALAYWKI